LNCQADFEIAQQGSLDGLCGLYSLVNFFTRLDDPDDVRKYSIRCLRIALAAQEDDGQLSAHNLMAGFWQGRLVSAAKKMSLKLAPSVIVTTVPSFISREEVHDPIAIAKALKGRGAAILNMNAPRGHWVLAFTTPTGAVKFDDPTTGKTSRLGSEVVSERKFDLTKGLVLTYA
jgi:hypothetical protein